MLAQETGGGGEAAKNGAPDQRKDHIAVRNLTMAYGSFVVMSDLNFIVKRGDIFVIMGG